MKKILQKFGKLFMPYALCLMPYTTFASVDSALVQKAETYLNGITGLSGDFTQTANGKKESGKFSMLRPGRVRLDYNKAPIQLISDGKDLYFFDKSLDQITTVPLSSTPAGILVRKNINLRNADIVVTETNTDANTFSLKMHMKDSPGLGSMAVIFDTNPVLLRAWTVIDATGATTEVSFSNLKTKTDFGKNFFQIQRHKTAATSGGDSFYE
ncbi:MAG: outer membrane lipoprotein carrier protein LolA [Alphaproteobacteria bacterium]|nr:outer membrane lipoprotein carrier protein LolA [Alphaproteobacteria bacterium]